MRQFRGSRNWQAPIHGGGRNKAAPSVLERMAIIRMVRGAVLGGIVFWGACGMAHAEVKDFSFSNICSYSGPDRAALTETIRERLAGQDQTLFRDLLGEDWSFWEARTPDVLMGPNEQPYRNSEGLSYQGAKRRCVDGGNAGIFIVKIESRADEITDADLEIIYGDEAFSERGEPLNWRRYSNSDQLQAAVASLISETTGEQELDAIMREAGFVRCQAEVREPEMTWRVYERPPYAPGTLTQKMGANYTPNGMPRLGATFDPSGRFAGFFKPYSNPCEPRNQQEEGDPRGGNQN